MAVIRKTKTAAKSKSTARPTASKKSTPTRTTATRSSATATKTKPAAKRGTTTRTAATPKRATTTRTAAKPAGTRTRKTVTPTPTRTAKAANRGTTATKTKASATTKKTTATKSRNVKTVAKPSAVPKTGPNRVVDDLTGFAVGTDSQVIATELLKGGESRAEIIERCAKKLPPTSNRGTPKPVANMVASVLGKMRDQGYTIESTWVLAPPTRASKARATRERNKRLGN